MPTTPTYALRYPAPTDPADVPTDMNNLATDVETALNGKQATSAKGVANGYASLDATGKVPAAQLPAAAAANAMGTQAARPAANSVAAGFIYYATDSLGLWRSDATQWWLVGQGSPYIAAASLSTAPWNAPYDGMRVTIGDASSWVSWEFRYNAGSTAAWKWEFIGGGAAITHQSTPQSISVGVWQNIAPTVFLVRRAGIYTWGATVTAVNNGGVNGVLSLALYRGSAAGGNALSFQGTAALMANNYLSMAVPPHNENQPANDTVGLMVNTGISNVQVVNATFWVVPIAIS